ncbi:MAG: hypothetical protein KAV87_10630 [Desulfobacteraceae bacterium]|nr:hypothetical protein [Desulfobacteraceae bacterium]
MSKGKKYKHKQPYKSEQQQLRAANTKLINKNEGLEKENNKLTVALRMLTGENKQDLLDAVDRLQNSNIWWTDPMTTLPITTTVLHTTNTTIPNTTISNIQYIIADDVGAK